MTEGFGATTPTEQPTGDTGGHDLYDDFRAALAVPVNVEQKEFRVPLRPNITLVFDPSLEYDLLQRFTKAATRKNETNPLRLAYSVLAKTNVAIKFDDTEVPDSEDQPLVLSHNEFHQMMKARDTQSAIAALFGSDGHVINMADRLISAAGYDDSELEEGNPL